MKSFSLLPTLITLFLTIQTAQAVDLMGMLSYNVSQVSTPPTHYLSKGNSVGYGFLGSIDFGPGKIETGFLYSGAQISTHESFGDVTVSANYWMVPLLYRYNFMDPFFSIAAGFDYAMVGNRDLSVGGSPAALANGLTSGFRSHWGAQISLEAAQDLGENLSAVFDARYRLSLADAISFGNEGTKYHFWMLGLGLRKRFDP